MERIVQGSRSDRSAKGRERILLVRLDAIGDYVLFRNHLRALRQSDLFRDVHLTVLGNPLWRDLAETFDADCADEWLWLADPGRYFKRGRENILPAFAWRKRVRAEQDALRADLRERSFDCVVSPRVDRDPLLDELLSGISPVLFGARSPRPLATDRLYTTLLEIREGPFTFDRNHSFLEALTGVGIEVPLALPLSSPEQATGQGPIILCIGASHWTRCLPRARLLALAKGLLAKTDRDLFLAGGRSDAPAAASLKRALGESPRVHITAGKVSLSAFADLAGTASCVVSHDTGPMHIAAAAGAPVVCVANGHTGKGSFWPYPDGRVRMCLPRSTSPLSSFLPLAQIQQARAIASIPVETIMDEVLAILR